MDIVEAKSPEALTLALKGRLDASSSGSLEEKVLKHIEGGERRIIIDFAQLDYISSVGLRVLMLASKRLKPVGGRLVLCALQPAVRQVFDIAGFSTILAIVDTRDQAVAKLA